MKTVHREGKRGEETTREHFLCSHKTKKKSSSSASVRVDEEWETFGQFEKSSYLSVPSADEYAEYAAAQD